MSDDPKPVTKSLTPKQAAFVREYLVDLNATAAAKRAGYSEDTAHSIGHENLSKPDISEAIEAEMEKRARLVGISAEWVLQQAVTLHRRCMQEIVPLLDRKGNQIIDENGSPVFAFDAKGAAAALTLVGKHVSVQAFKDAVDVSGQVALIVSQEDADL